MAFFSYPDAQRYPPGSLLDPHVCDLYQCVGVMESVYDYVVTQGVPTRKDVVALKPLNALALFVNLPAIDLSGANQLRSQETKREEISRDGNNDIFDTHPLHTAQSLAVQGMHAQFLRKPADSRPDQTVYFSSTGAAITIDNGLRRSILQALLLERADLFRINQALSDYLPSKLQMSSFKNCVPDYWAAHAYQLLLILMHNRIHFGRVRITKDFTELSIKPVLSSSDLVNLHSALHQFP